MHCSLNLNTETGRLSARRPNLQNQPALEKDRYKVWRLIQCLSLDWLSTHYRLEIGIYKPLLLTFDGPCLG